MAVWVYYGDDFDAADELRSLRDAYTGDFDKSSGIVSGFYELSEIRNNGFLPHDRWSRHGNLFLFQEYKFRMAATVPGDGRLQTRDVMLVVSETFDLRAQARSTQSAFLDRARERIGRGRVRRWSLL
ncbi:hypothetical protein [Chelativorans intermedius]|uniref:Uncharacterized protein n=1 Tax=Chelativorans intermedius TaxID=515947 RepID=A0ABV6D7P6_9HYPH|nr:hypothetical protein [Chelativorans intermedius]MCT8999833.1 hypothetical protein [Chelativorans intermedius]